MSGNKCSMCHRVTGDVTNYHFTSSEAAHTFWSFDLCIGCRDGVFKFIEGKSKRGNTRVIDPHDPDGGEY
jgi:hypothetical protein